jgi:hypothetical protein bfra3_07217
MPHLHGDILVVTADELVPKYYSTLGHLRVTIWRYKDKPYGIRQVQKGGNGRQMLIAFDSLPHEIQEAIGDPRKMQHPLLHFWEINPLAVNYYTTYTFEDGDYLKTTFQEEYITNASVLIALARLRDHRISLKNGKKIGIMESLRTDLISFNPILEKIHGRPHTLEVGERHFVRIFNAFIGDTPDTYRFESLISGKLRSQNAKKMTTQMIELLNAIFAGQDHKPTRTEVSRQYEAFLSGYIQIVNNETGELYNPKDAAFKPISESSIIAYLAQWENTIATHTLRSGDRQKLMQKFIPYHSLERPKEAGIILSIDDRQPPFFYDKGKRLWFYMGIDLGSEAWTAWVYGETKEGLILDFYRQLVRNYCAWGFNLPLELECESSLNASFADTFLRNGAMFSRVRIERNKARAKRIERYFGNLRYNYEAEHEGFLGRPFALKEDNQSRQPKDKLPIICKEQIINNALSDIVKWNNTEHSIYKGKTRWEVFCERQSTATQPINWRAILPSLGYSTQSSCHAGIVRFRSSEYLLAIDSQIALGDDLIRLMRRVEGKSFTIYWLDDNEGNTLKALIYHEDTLLCELLPKPTYPRSIYEMDQAAQERRTLMSAYENTVEAYMRERKNQIEPLTIIGQRPTTLNHKFTISGLKTYQPTTTTAQVIETAEEELIYTPAQQQNTRLSKGLFETFCN